MSNTQQIIEDMHADSRGAWEVTRDNRILSMLSKLIERHYGTVQISENCPFDQTMLIGIILAFKQSRFYRADNDKKVFMNILNSTIQAGIRKLRVRSREILLSLQMRGFNFLTKAAKVMWEDDHCIDELFMDFAEQLGWFGTGILKIHYRSDEKHKNRVVPITDILWDPQHAEKHPMGEHSCVSLQAFKDMTTYSQEVKDKVIAGVQHRAGENLDSANAKLRLYEIHGLMPECLFKEDSDSEKLVQGKYIVAEHIDSETTSLRHCEFMPVNGIVVFAGEEDKHPYHIHRDCTIPNRSMGYGLAEHGVIPQVVANKLFNLMLRSLKTSAVTILQTDDPELKYDDLLNIKDMSIIQNSPGTQLSTMQFRSNAYNQLQDAYAMVMNLHKQGASIQDFALGIGPKSNVPFAVQEAAAREADGQYAERKEAELMFFKKIFKMDCGWLDQIIDYFDDPGEIDSLLSPYALRSYRRAIAESKAAKIQQEQLEQKGAMYVDDFESLTNFILDNEVRKKTYKVSLPESLVNKDSKKLSKDARDKIKRHVRFTFGNELDIITADIGQLEKKLQLALNYPDRFTNYDVNSIQKEIDELTNLTTAYASPLLPSQSTLINQTPTGPNVAALAAERQVDAIPRL